MNKILLAVDEDSINDLIIANYYNPEFIENIEQEKADAEQIVKDKCIALIDEVLKEKRTIKDEENGLFDAIVVEVDDILKIKEKL